MWLAPSSVNSMAMVIKPVESLSEIKPKRLYFVGATSPADHLLECAIGTKKMVEIPETTKQQRHSAAAAARSAEEAQAAKDLRDLKKKLKKQTVEFREMFVLLARIVGVDISD